MEILKASLRNETHLRWLAMQNYFSVNVLNLSFASTSVKLEQTWDASDETFKEAVFTDETLFSRKFANQIEL